MIPRGLPQLLFQDYLIVNPLLCSFSYEKWVPLDNCRDEKINEMNQKNKSENDKNNRDREYNPVQDNKFKKTKENPQGEPL